MPRNASLNIFKQNQLIDYCWIKTGDEIIKYKKLKI